MFRRKKTIPSDTGNPAGTTEQADGGHDDGGLPLKQNASSTGSYMTKPSIPQPRAEIPRRVVDIPGAPRRSSDASDGKRLIVGRDISLSGSISACERLVVEGTVEANLPEAGALEVTETGTHRGDVTVDEAEIAGRFEGTLTARKKLTIRGTGKVRGTIRYGRLVVEHGGELVGTVEAMPYDEPRPRMPIPPISRPPEPQE